MDASQISESRIPTNLRTLLLLETLAGAGKAMTATEMGKAVGLAKQTSHRLCVRLEAEGFITREGTSKRFIPARRLRDIASGLMFTSRLHIARHQVLEDLARQIGETINFVVPEPGGMSYLDRVETNWPIRAQLPVGSNVPFHCTASGKAFMSSLAPRDRRNFVSSLSLSRHTAKTHITEESLLADLAEISQRGYSIDNEEFVEGMVALAVPVTDAQGRFVAALALHGPLPRVSLRTAIASKDTLVEGAARLSQTLYEDNVQSF